MKLNHLVLLLLNQTKWIYRSWVKYKKLYCVLFYSYSNEILGLCEEEPSDRTLNCITVKRQYCKQERDFQLILNLWIRLIKFDKNVGSFRTHSPWGNTSFSFHTYLKDRNTVLLTCQMYNVSNITWASWHRKSSATQLLVQADKCQISPAVSSDPLVSSCLPSYPPVFFIRGHQCCHCTQCLTHWGPDKIDAI